MNLFIMPLPFTVFFPQTSRPLKILEYRYQKMIKDSLNEGIPIAIAMVEEELSEIKYEFDQPLKLVSQIVGYGVPILLQQPNRSSSHSQSPLEAPSKSQSQPQAPSSPSDSTPSSPQHNLENDSHPPSLQPISVFLKGLGKARLGKTVDLNKPFITCTAEPVFETFEIKGQCLNKFERLQKMFENWVIQHIPNIQDRRQFFSQITSPQELIAYFSTYTLVDHDIRQQLLEMDDINERIDFIYDLILSGGLKR